MELFFKGCTLKTLKGAPHLCDVLFDMFASKLGKKKNFPFSGLCINTVNRNVEIQITFHCKWFKQCFPCRLDFSSHVNHIHLVLQRHLQHQLYVKGEKCKFHKEGIAFLGYNISAQGISMNQKKVDAVLNWPTPQTVKVWQKCIGLAHFYRKFIRNYSTIAAPLTSLTKGGGKKLSWNPEGEAAFKKLKEAFTTPWSWKTVFLWKSTHLIWG